MGVREEEQGQTKGQRKEAVVHCRLDQSETQS
jgi:hypothetical protein